MRAVLICCLGCSLAVGCASPSPPPKPSPYRFRPPERIEARSSVCLVSIHP
jgi:hypothetical protein